MAYLLAATSQSIGIIWFCNFIAPVLEAEYPIGRSWKMITMGLGLATCVYIYYGLIRMIIRQMDQQ